MEGLDDYVKVMKVKALATDLVVHATRSDPATAVKALYLAAAGLSQALGVPQGEMEDAMAACYRHADEFMRVKRGGDEEA